MSSDNVHENVMAVPEASLGGSSIDKLLVAKLSAYTRANDEYWSFRHRTDWDSLMEFCQYPGMMVPTMQGCLLEVACQVDPSIEWILDPYVGSGTTLGEAIRRKLSFVGQDINPLAVLLCRAKMIPFHHSIIKAASDAVMARVERDRSESLSVTFPGRDKWFKRSVAKALSKIRRAIIAEDDVEIRRFLWVCLAETVRRTSNSRTSTYKIHIRSKAELEKRAVSTLAVFASVLSTNLENLREVEARLTALGSLDSSHRYIRSTQVVLGDTMVAVPPCESKAGYDLLITSPPYGDNDSTVPYGQFSYLPLQWIPLSDIDANVDPSCLCSTHEIDHRSIGGSKVGALNSLTKLKERSAVVADVVDQLKDKPADRLVRVAAYLRDIDKSLDPIMKALRPGALMFWTIGNRRVGGIQIPTNEILKQLLESRNAVFLTEVDRRIPTKRMAVRNSIAPTMRREQILVLRKR